MRDFFIHQLNDVGGERGHRSEMVDQHRASTFGGRAPPDRPHSVSRLPRLQSLMQRFTPSIRGAWGDRRQLRRGALSFRNGARGLGFGKPSARRPVRSKPHPDLPSSSMEKLVSPSRAYQPMPLTENTTS